jgi:formate hydrogenlyase subunit 3/multisubunit Na+/H+ antiporter MnhD subunit
MIPVLLISIPLLTGIVAFFLKEAGAARGWALLSSLISLAVAIAGVFFYPKTPTDFRRSLVTGSRQPVSPADGWHGENAVFADSSFLSRHFHCHL